MPDTVCVHCTNRVPRSIFSHDDHGKTVTLYCGPIMIDKKLCSDLLMLGEFHFRILCLALSELAPQYRVGHLLVDLGWVA